MILNRRGFLAGILAAGVAPAIVREPMKLWTPPSTIWTPEIDGLKVRLLNHFIFEHPVTVVAGDVLTIHHFMQDGEYTTSVDIQRAGTVRNSDDLRRLITF